MIHRLPFLLGLLLIVVLPSAARADRIHPGEGSHVAAIAAAPPSTEHPWGTMLAAWCEQDPDDSTVHLGEWDLHATRWLSADIVRHHQSCPATLRLAWSKQRLVLVIGTDPQATTELIVLERRAPRFVEIDTITFDDAEAPSLDVDDHFIALATYEHATPIDGADASNMRTPPAFLALHVRLFDPASLRIVGARMFRGEHLLRRHTLPELAGHAIRFLGGRLYVAVADREPRIVATRLPSLATEIERTFAVPPSLRTVNSSSIVLNRLGDALVIGIESTYVLSSKLEDVAKRDRSPITQPIAFDSATRRVLATDGEPMTLAGWSVRVAPAPATTVLFAHGRGVIIGGSRPTIRVLTPTSAP